MKINFFVRGFLVFALSIFFNGCLYTIYPFFTEKDVMYNPELIGNWAYASNSGKGFVLFEPITGREDKELPPGIKTLAYKGYIATWKDSSGQLTSQYFAFLAKIGKYFYLDYYPADLDYESKVDQIYKMQQLKLHSCYRINFQDKNNFQVKLFDGEFLEDLINKKQIRIRYEELNSLRNRKIITASTEELQRYLLKYSDNPKAYNEHFAYNCTRMHYY